MRVSANKRAEFEELGRLSSVQSQYQPVSSSAKCPQCLIDLPSNEAVLEHLQQENGCWPEVQDHYIPVPPAFLRSIKEAGKDDILGRYHPSSGYIFGKAPNIPEAMESDQFAYRRCHTPFYPFQDQAEFELGKFLCERLTQSDIDRFLKLEWVRQAKPSFSSKDQLLAWMASLPTGPKWRSTTLEITGYPTIQPIQLIWRNGLDVVEDLFANPIFVNHMTYDPHVVVDGDEREYSEYFTAKQAFEIQDQLPKGATIVPVIIASDKTPVTRHTGGLEMHPIFVSLANIQSDVRIRATSHAWRCVGFMPIPKFSDVHTDYQTILSQRLFHKCMDIIFADVKVTAMAGKFMPDLSGHLRHCYTPLAAYTADLPEQQAIACVSKVASPITLATSQSFGDSYRYAPCTKEHTLSVIYDICQHIDPWRLREFQEEAKAHSLSGVHQPFWRNWRFADPARFLSGEILHTCHKFFFDHPFKWSKELVGKDELDARFRSHHKRVGMRHFSSGVRQMKQMTGREHRDLQRTLVPSIAGVTPPQFIHAIRALIDFIYKAQNPVYTDTSVDSMVASLKEFHDHKQAILDAGARRGTKGTIDNFLIPKLELLQSFAVFTKDIGALIQWTAHVTERLLITHCKLPFDRTSLTEEQEITETNPALAWIARIAPGDPNQRCFVGPRPVQNHFLKGILSSTATTAFHVTVAPDRAKMSINEVQQLYVLPDFGQALSDYIAKASNGQPLASWSSGHGRVKTWNKFRLQLHSVFCSRLIMPSQVVQAAPPSQTFPLGNCDAVVAQSVHGDRTVNIVAQVRAIFQPIPPLHGTLPHYLADQPLIYVQYYEIVGHPHDEPAISMYMVARQYHNGPDGQRMRLGAVIPLTDVTHAVELIPMYGAGADRTVGAATSMELYEHFYLNNFSDKEIYHALCSDLH
ncbi:uncharacterized protein HD556DRAFT_1314634 [Suillus plorans]|uniref:DUF6830 domain-containing protein n=1 Tax=Suillus plorans TaxID=116603 RepID=A0A9P7A9H4_9AGAM|nr:uncharacterized protein HD556DRAFT_1314634 [Suillus plorans]KAG1784969.1 hypothetical protein HD556DRAFT_1314634 [Suillus plorans]